MPPPRRTLEYWQSYSDIAMAFMATLILVLVVLLHKQRKEGEERRVEADRLTEFAVELLTALDEAKGVAARQDDVGNWLSHVFRETDGCKLEYEPSTHNLVPRGGVAAELYAPGAVQLSDAALLELAACRGAFLAIAACMSPSGSSAATGCSFSSGEWGDKVVAFREDVEALVITGNTDRVAFGQADRLHGRSRNLRPFSDSFVANAQLGAERARQALGHLLLLLEPDDDRMDRQPDSALQVFMNRASIESPAFGPFQAGPSRNRRAPQCEGLDCPAARSLALRLRWKTTSLRDPFNKVKTVFCKELPRLESSLTTEQALKAHALCGRQ